MANKEFTLEKVVVGSSFLSLYLGYSYLEGFWFPFIGDAWIDLASLEDIVKSALKPAIVFAAMIVVYGLLLRVLVGSFGVAKNYLDENHSSSIEGRSAKEIKKDLFWWNLSRELFTKLPAVVLAISFLACCYQFFQHQSFVFIAAILLPLLLWEYLEPYEEIRYLILAIGMATPVVTFLLGARDADIQKETPPFILHEKYTKSLSPTVAFLGKLGGERLFYSLENEAITIVSESEFSQLEVVRNPNLP